MQGSAHILKRQMARHAGERCPPLPSPVSANGERSIAVAQVKKILMGVRRQGRDIGMLLQRAGLAPAVLEKEHGRVSVHHYARLINVLRRATKDELWGLCSRRVPLGSFALASRLMISRETLGDALREGCHLYHLLLDDFTPRLIVANGKAYLRIIESHPSCPRQAFAQRTLLFFARGLASWLIERRLPINRVHLSGEDGEADTTETSQLFQAPVSSGESYTELVFNAEWLNLPVRQDEASRRVFLKSAMPSLLVKYRNDACLTERVRVCLRRRLAESLPSLVDMANELGLSPQTLRRRLKDAGSGFQYIKDEVRRDAAIDYLMRADISLMEVASRVGFSEPSTFHRAFKKWTGHAPGVYRETRLKSTTEGQLNRLLLIYDTSWEEGLKHTYQGGIHQPPQKPMELIT
ncbi:AraC family transcriptional regulator [Vreelandella aquamarina]|nr:AraC family transcriptional regulator [Halomonas meridiana]